MHESGATDPVRRDRSSPALVALGNGLTLPRAGARVPRMVSELAKVWPVAGLRAVSGDLELRWASDDDLLALAGLAAGGIHADDYMPFTFPWTRGEPDEVRRSVLAYHWRKRAAQAPEAWTIDFAVVHDGTVVGSQGASAADFPVTRTAETGSWLGTAHQGQGVGTRMRLLVLHLLFDGLGAQEATTGAFVDNAPSNGVTRRLGYRANGEEWHAREGSAARTLKYAMSREDWERRPDELRPDVLIEGADAARAFLGLA